MSEKNTLLYCKKCGELKPYTHSGICKKCQDKEDNSWIEKLFYKISPFNKNNNFR